MKPDHITLLVSSLDRSMPYYAQLLPLVGFRKLRDHVWTDDDGFHFQFLQARPDTSPYERYGAGMNHLGFGVPCVEDVHAVGEAMRSAGFDVPDIQNLGGATALFMKDPDGIRFEITHTPPGLSVVD
ncbi:VOC family protein [Montanilutibacter psychrotolerans]|uniref:VOC family protein n=1 Tax=Montanilutibacter psychrotolerans TaxID=1327343 RepID=A0A3M8SYK7_9GAMM|nr:VOC family protein [Lysobacter psychrotolerans]RNF85913.1 VOC family protein [Lysobacter psychrotolerans]